ncbi:glycerophosphodiester phosphodiesterase [Nocardia sp. CA-135953]|uniref:glycerophosphodiester phosphodiesterase n=1 Tax=Nocardia sp. CA-135953 TaxID=3239978 RepID=UPI003D995A33
MPEKYVAAAASFGANMLSPVHGSPQDGTVEDPGYAAFTTAELIRAAHERGMTVVPWTVDDRPTMTALIDLGVGGLISNRPDLLRTILAERGYRLPTMYHR